MISKVKEGPLGGPSMNPWQQPRNPAKQQRRTVKSQKRKLDKCRNKMREHQAQQAIYGQRNSYAKTDHDAPFKRVKEDPI